MNMERPIVSIIIPVYNVDRYIDCCLNSIRNQTYDRLDIIVVEDCSTDTSIARIKPHLTDQRVRMIRHKRNSGLSAARNTGIDVALGDYVMFVDSDDAIAPALVKECIDRIAGSDSDVLVFDFKLFNDAESLPEMDGSSSKGNLRRLNRPEYLRFPHFAWLKFIRRKILNNPRLRFPVGYFYEDWPFHWELGFSTEKIDHVPLNGYAYRIRNNSITSSLNEKLLHIFDAQYLITEVARHHVCDRSTELELINKAFVSGWYVLTNIDEIYVFIALRSWKNCLQQYKFLNIPRSPKQVILIALAIMPPRISMVFLRIIRKMLNRGVVIPP